MNVPKLAESIPAVTAPVKLPKLVPGRAWFLANVIGGGALLTLTVVLLVVALVVTS